MEDPNDIPVSVRGVEAPLGSTATLPRTSERRWVLYAGLVALGIGVVAAVAIWNRRPSARDAPRGSDDYRASAPSADAAARSPTASAPTVWKRNRPPIPPLDDWYVQGSVTTLADAEADLGTAWRLNGTMQMGDLTTAGVRFALVPNAASDESLGQAISYRREQASNQLKHVSGKTTVFWTRSCKPTVGLPDPKAWEQNLRHCDALRGQPVHVVASVAQCTGPAGTAILEAGSYPLATGDVRLKPKRVFELRLVPLSVLCASLQTTYVVDTQKSVQELRGSIEQLKKQLKEEYGGQLAKKDKVIQELEGKIKDMNAEIERLKQDDGSPQSNPGGDADATP